MTSPAPQQAEEPSAGREPWPLGRMIWAGVAASVLVALVAAVVAGAAFHTLSAARHQVISVADPAATQTLQLYASMINQETGVRGYELSAAPNFLQPYTSGLTQQRSAQAALRSLLGDVPGASRDLATVDRRISDWQVRYATPTIARVRASGKPAISPGVDQGKADFDALRASVSVAAGRHQPVPAASRGKAGRRHRRSAKRDHRHRAGAAGHHRAVRAGHPPRRGAPDRPARGRRQDGGRGRLRPRGAGRRCPRDHRTRRGREPDA